MRSADLANRRTDRQHYQWFMQGTNKASDTRMLMTTGHPAAPAHLTGFAVRLTAAAAAAD